jgi:DNA polymerase III subunit gamma/tau
MSYQVIARKYRPQRFSDVVGQDHVTQTLANAIAQNRIAHAYLFVGPRGTGKTTMARIFAKCLNCTGGPSAQFDDENDPRCREIAEGRSLDVLEIDGASNRGIEEIRELRETVKYAPANSRFKIYIIDEVHMLTKEAFNALLKTLEEPPAHVKFMFATTEPEKVLPTILSRCQRFDLRRIPSSLIVKHLAHIAAQEKVQIDAAALYAIARGADGGMRDAESTLDQLISFCGTEIAEADVLSMFGLTARSQILDLTHAVIAGEFAQALQQLTDLSKNGKDLSRLLSDLLQHFRNLLLFQLSGGDLSLLEASEAELAGLAEQSKAISSDALIRIMEILSDAETRLRDAASKKILVEVSLLKAIQARQAVPIDTILKTLHEMRDQSPGAGASPVAASAPSSPAREPTRAPAPSRIETSVLDEAPTAAVPAPAPAPAAAPVPPPSTGPASLEGPALEELWGKIIDAAGAFARSYLLEAFPISLGKGVMTVGIDPASDHLALLDNPRNRTLIQTKLQELGHPGVQVRIISAPEPEGRVRPVAPPPPPPAPAPPAAPAKTSQPSATAPALPAGEAAKPEPALLSKEDFKNDPLIRQALEIFRGTLIDART